MQRAPKKYPTVAFIESRPEIHPWVLPSFVVYMSAKPLGWSPTRGSRRVISGPMGAPTCTRWVIQGGDGEDEELWGAIGGGGVSNEEEGQGVLHYSETLVFY